MPRPKISHTPLPFGACMAVAGHLFTVTELNGCFDLPDTDKFVPIVPSSVETMLVHPKSLTITFIAGRKTRNSFTLPSIPSPAVRLVVSTFAHLYSDVLLSKVFSILFEKKTLPWNGRMMRLSRETATSFTLGAPGSQRKSGLTDALPFWLIFNL
jgi:hypothetical protein